MLNFLKNLQFIFMPHYWLMNEPYSKVWDKKLNELLDKHEFTDINPHTAMLGRHEIWIANYPYRCFMPYSLIRGKSHKFRASRLTILRAYKKLKPVNNADFYAKKYIDDHQTPPTTTLP